MTASIVAPVVSAIRSAQCSASAEQADPSMPTTILDLLEFI
jgi:hypothetical protein